MRNRTALHSSNSGAFCLAESEREGKKVHSRAVCCCGRSGSYTMGKTPQSPRGKMHAAPGAPTNRQTECRQRTGSTERCVGLVHSDQHMHTQAYTHMQSKHIFFVNRHLNTSTENEQHQYQEQVGKRWLKYSGKFLQVQSSWLTQTPFPFIS